MLWDFDALSLYHFAIWDEKSTYPIIETGYAFTVDMNDEVIHIFNNQTFTQGRAISNVFYYNPKKFLSFKISPLKKKLMKLKYIG